jgi:hypothetical protein
MASSRFLVFYVSKALLSVATSQIFIYKELSISLTTDARKACHHTTTLSGLLEGL